LRAPGHAEPSGCAAKVATSTRAGEDKLGGVWADFVADSEKGAYRVVHPTDADLARAAELELAYEDLALGFVDASIVALCERLGETNLATLDRRHFSVVRPRHCSHLTLVPD
jgi:predicted nucleic acid-binding protein